MPKVIVLGGGVAGMSAAHELIERGYEVEVYEKNANYVGGKARSIDYYGVDINTNKDVYSIPLPGEHGFRFFPGFYKHIIDTMRRIPFKNANGKTKTVFNNLVSTSRVMLARYGKTPIVTVASFPKNLSDIELLIHDIHGVDSGLTSEQIKFFAERIWQLITSCANRRNFEYERLGWWQYLEADRFPGKDGHQSAYQSLLVQGLTRTLVAAQAKTASTKTGGNIFLQLIFGMTDPTVDTDRVLDGPTNDRWLIAWKEYLLSKGVKYTNGCEVTKISMNNIPADDLISGATIKLANGSFKEIIGDYYILAVPVERAANLINDDMIKADMNLGYIKTLAPSVNWMNGVQFYLNQDVVINKGHVIYSDSEWAITSISQVQFWDDYDITTKGPVGKVKGLLSVDVSDWQVPGKFTTKKPASQCTRQEVANEVWEQLKHSLNVDGNIVLSDDMKVDFFVDRDIMAKASQHTDTLDWNEVVQDVIKEIESKLDDDAKEILNNSNVLKWLVTNDIATLQGVTDMSLSLLDNREPLLVNKVNTWSLRPDANCGIPNLFFASDYVKTFTDLATMEGANEAARRAVNCLLDKDKNNATKCEIWPLKEPAVFKPIKWYDQIRYNQGLPWSMHIPWWLKLFMIPWTGVWIVLSFFNLILIKILNLFK